MSRFTQPWEPLGRFISADVFRLEETLEYWLGPDETGTLLIVPVGFETDFASIPKLFQNLLSKFDTHRRAAIIHDYLYRTHGKGGMYNRERCDQIFLEAMKVLGVPWLKRKTMYRAVRLFGWASWNKERAERKAVIEEKKQEAPPPKQDTLT